MFLIVISLFLYSTYFSLGAIHDGSTAFGIDAKSCPASMNNIMTSTSGLHNVNGSFLTYSSCSISAFKSTLLAPDMR